MPSHFSTIGFPVDSTSACSELATKIARLAKRIPVRDGAYLLWSGSDGAQVWLQVDSTNTLIGMNPHFAGKSAIPVGIRSILRRPGETPFDGAIQGGVNETEPGAEDGDFPIVADVPNLGTHERLKPPASVTAQVAAFAHEASFSSAEAEYEAAQQHEVKFASKSFIPSGMFEPGGEATEPPQAYAIFSGHVLEAEAKRNEMTGETYYWALVDSLGGTFDVVIDPEVLPELPRSGGILSGSFWLSGTFPPVPKRGFLRKLTRKTG